MRHGKPARSAKPKAAIRLRGPGAPIGRLRSPAAVRRSKRLDTTVLAAEVRRLERELAEAHRRLVSLATRADVDPLTGLLNRRAFERELARALAYAKRHGTSIALVYLDLDEFKRINDRHGHGAGDAMLGAIASVLGRHVRESDLVARHGGDEFALLLWNCDEAYALAKALALEAAIGRTTAVHGGAVLSVGASAGIAMLLPLDRPEQTIERADRAMYGRKAARRVPHAAE